MAQQQQQMMEAQAAQTMTQGVARGVGGAAQAGIQQAAMSQMMGGQPGGAQAPPAMPPQA